MTRKSDSAPRGMIRGQLVRVAGFRGVCRFLDATAMVANVVDADAKFHAFRPERVGPLCAHCTKAFDTRARIPGACPLCQALRERE